MSRISPQVGKGAGCKDFSQDIGEEREERKVGNRLEKFLSARHLDLILQVKQPWKGEEYNQKLCSEKLTLWWLWGVISRALRITLRKSTDRIYNTIDMLQRANPCQHLLEE